ncbi:hypothetical protein ACH5RR_039949 [Cinchona calisaya]|uniref:Uncharacterized protein n=1 Tax=Cinchona calisaya TaxID=153742 RepID=A0ABD2XZS9_9GENT
MEPGQLSWPVKTTMVSRAQNTPVPINFSTALKNVRDRKSGLANDEELITWKPPEGGSDGYSYRARPPPLSSVLDPSLLALAENADQVDSLENVSDSLRGRLADMICDLGKMDIRVFRLFVKGSSTEIYIKDCSWLTEEEDEEFLKTFEDFDAESLMVLQLEQCGQLTDDDVLRKTLARSPNSLPNLSVISLKGAYKLSNDGLNALVISAPALQSVNLSGCFLLTDVGINILAESLGSILRELCIDYCTKIDAMEILPALNKFEHLEVLSVAGIETVCDQFVSDLLTACGHNIKKLNFSNCLKLTDTSLVIIGGKCNGLLSLNISNLNKLTNLGLEHLADGCRCIETLILCRNSFSDDAVAAFLEASGRYLKELSLNSVAEVGSSTAFSLANFSRDLLSLDLSWCQKITDQALGMIVDYCLSLKLLKLFGCTQITNVFLDGHSNAKVHVIMSSNSRLEILCLLQLSEDISADIMT